MTGCSVVVMATAVTWASLASSASPEATVDAAAVQADAVEPGREDDAGVDGEAESLNDAGLEPSPREDDPAQEPATEATPSVAATTETPGVAAADSPRQRAAAFAVNTRAGITLRLIDHHAGQARRERLVSGGIGLAVAGSQVGLGVVGYVALDDAGTGMRRSAIGQMAVGSLGIATSVMQLAVRSPLERLRGSATYNRLSANPADPVAYERLYTEWNTAAKRARKRRLALSGIGLGVGAVLTTVATVRLAAADTTNGERVWAYTTLASGVGVVFASLTGLLLRSESERSFAAIEAAQPPVAPRVRVAPGLGGMTVHGRF